uniref:Uncharacterized protein n=1 Tax=Arundo donax TaxID=35708 RepID=A0A0A8ZGS8_ARUDO
MLECGQALILEL